MAFDYFSDQLTNVDKVPSVWMKPNENGKLRVKFFSYTVPAGNLATDKLIELCRLPKGARILRGRFASEAMSTAGGTAGCEIGDGTTSDLFKAKTSVDAAAAFDFASTIAENQGLELTVDTSIVAKTKDEAWAAGAKLNGYVIYVGA